MVDASQAYFTRTASPHFDIDEVEREISRSNFLFIKATQDYNNNRNI